MKTRKRALTAQIKPATRNAIMDQLAVAADEIIELREDVAWLGEKASKAWLRGYFSAVAVAALLGLLFTWWRA